MNESSAGSCLTCQSAYLHRRAESTKQQRLGRAHKNAKLTVLAHRLLLHRTAVHGVHQLHAIANAENRHADGEEARVEFGRVGAVHGLRSARDDDGLEATGELAERRI